MEIKYENQDPDSVPDDQYAVSNGSRYALVRSYTCHYSAMVPRYVPPSADRNTTTSRISLLSTGSSSINEKRKTCVFEDEVDPSPKSVLTFAPTGIEFYMRLVLSMMLFATSHIPMSNAILMAQALSAEVFRLHSKVEALKDKLDLANQEQTSLEKAMLVGRSQALREVASSGISVKLVDMKDFDPNAKQNYDRAIESFYQVKFPYVDLLVHYAGQSMGKLMTLKPPIISFRNASAAGPSASPFL
ncbi:hypothetical protein Tco_1014261 [Tanacetum coccineum]